jgi:hypothetical protein
MILFCTILFLFFYLLWILTSIFRQFFNKKLPKFVVKICVEGFSFFFPVFTLFAPRPASVDYHIAYRYPDSSDREMTSIEYNKRRSLLNILWNPHLKYQKLLISSIRNLNGMKKSLMEKEELDNNLIKKIIFSSKPFNIIKKLVFINLMENKKIRKGKLQIIIFKSAFDKNKELMIIPEWVHTFRI